MEIHISSVCACGGNPLVSGDPCAVISVITTFSKNQFFQLYPQRHNLNCSACTRWHTLSYDSQLLPDIIKRCETQAGLPYSYTLTVSSYFHLILFSDKHGRAAKRQKYVRACWGNDQAGSDKWSVTLTVHKPLLAQTGPYNNSP